MNGSLESLARLRVQALLLLLGVFLIGVVAGIAIEHWRQPGPPERHHDGLPPHLREQLDLTADQSTRIDAILTGSRDRTDAVFEAFLPRLRALTDSIRAEVRAELTPEQQAIFDRIEPSLMDGPPGGPPDGRHRHDDRRPGRPPDRDHR